MPIKILFAAAALLFLLAMTACAPQRYTVGAIVTRDHEVSSKPPVPKESQEIFSKYDLKPLEE